MSDYIDGLDTPALDRLTDHVAEIKCARGSLEEGIVQNARSELAKLKQRIRAIAAAVEARAMVCPECAGTKEVWFGRPNGKGTIRPCSKPCPHCATRGVVFALDEGGACDG